MMRAQIFSLFALLLAASMPLQALTLSPDHLAAAESLSCVLAEDALGYLDEDQFNSRFDASVTGFNEQAVDVIYAKALGYIDGLLFGVSSLNNLSVSWDYQHYIVYRAASAFTEQLVL